MRITELLAEAKNPKMQAAIAINMKKRHQKPKSEGVAEGLHPMIIDDVKKLATLSPTDRYSAYANIRDYFKADPALSKMASDLMGGYYEADMLRGKYKTDAAKAKYAELEPMHQAFIKQAIGQEQGVAEGNMDGKVADIKGQIAELEAEQEQNEFGSYAYDTVNGELQYLYAKLDKAEKGVAEGETWSKHNNKRVGGMSKKSVKSYRRSHPGSKIQTAVTTKPSKIKKGSKDAKRRKSFCARMRGMKKHNTSAKTARDPNSNINKSLRRWHCESVEQMLELVMLAEQFIQNRKKSK